VVNAGDRKHFHKALSRNQWAAMWIFIGAIAVVAVLRCRRVDSTASGWQAAVDGAVTIQMFMLMAGALIILFTKTNPTAIAKSEVFRAGMIAVVAVFGVAWRPTRRRRRSGLRSK